jgi:CxxC-x17-CxxC domain-containing protein
MERYGSGNRGGYNSGPREMSDATCAECGKTCQVPFKPDGSRPVYCSDCYQKHKPASSSRPPRRY